MTEREQQLEAEIKKKDEEIQALKAKVEDAYKQINRLIDIKWNYESVLDLISSDEVAEAKGQLGLDYCDFDTDYYPERVESEEEEDESGREESEG